MLRRKDDMKEWQREAIKDESIEKKIVGIVAPQGIPSDDLPDVPEEAVVVVKPKKSPVKKAPAKKATKKAIEKMEVNE